MPIPTFSGLPPYPEFQDVVNKINKLVNELRNLMLNLDTLNVVSLNAKVIEAGTITADKMNVTELSAISANLGHITAGLIEAVQIFGSYIATSQSYPKVEISNTENLFKASQDGNRYIEITPFWDETPQILLNNMNILRALQIFISENLGCSAITTIGKLQISANGDLELFGTNVKINGVNFNNKADKSNVFKTGYISSTPGGPADTFISIQNGIVAI